VVFPALAIGGVSAIEADTARAIRHVRMRPWPPRMISSPSSALWPTSRPGVLMIQEYLGAQNCYGYTRESTEIEADKAMSEQVISRTEASYEGVAFVTYADGSQEIHYDVNNRGDAADQARAGYARRLAQRSGGIPARESSRDGATA
jgi:hypothetical protein